jgi:hypothetical protein
MALAAAPVAGVVSRRLWISAAGLVLACLLVYHLNGRPHPEVDCVAAPYTAWSLVRHQSLDLRDYPELGRLVGTHVRQLADGSWVSIRPPGSALVAVPFVAPFAVRGEQPLSARGMYVLGKAAGACSVALAAGLFFLVCRRLCPDAAWPATVLFALGTCLCSVASQALWMHGPAALWLCVALYLLTHEGADRVPWRTAAGLALGLAAVTRPTTVFFGLATGLTLLARRRWRATAWLTLGGAVPVACLCLLNWWLFGNLFLGGYDNDNWQESPPFWLGLGGLLVAPSRGVLVYSPALLLAPLGLWRLRRDPTRPGDTGGLILAWGAAAGVTVLFYARWYHWFGGWSYGPRMLCETMPVLCLLFGIAYQSLRAAWGRRLGLALVALSVAVHLVGLFGYSGYVAWQERHDRQDQGRCLFALHDTQIEAHARALLRKLLGRDGA